MSHTPFPWHVGLKPGPMVYGPRGELVADCRSLGAPEEDAANARAIAAIGELVAALEEAERVLSSPNCAGRLFAKHLLREVLEKVKS